MPKLSLFKPTLFSASQGGQELGGRSIMEMGTASSLLTSTLAQSESHLIGFEAL
jgi:hypothetical protein